MFSISKTYQYLSYNDLILADSVRLPAHSIQNKINHLLTSTQSKKAVQIQAPQMTCRKICYRTNSPNATWCYILYNKSCLMLSFNRIAIVGTISKADSGRGNDASDDMAVVCSSMSPFHSHRSIDILNLNHSCRLRRTSFLCLR